MTVVGTRPEIIRLSRIIARMDQTFEHTLIHTGQNYDYELNQVFFDEMGLPKPDRYLGVDTTTLGRVLAGTLIGVEEALIEVRPDAFVVLGDTNSAIAALMARRLQVPVYHLEAGNRCFDLNVPEEVNRRLVDHVADFNLVYTEHARRNLLDEGLPARQIGLIGSPLAEVLGYYEPVIAASTILSQLRLRPGGYLLVSAHREENVDEPERIEQLVATLALAHREFDCPVLVSTHPRTRERLQSCGLDNTEGLVFHKPFGFLDYVRLQRDALCVLSDSGTISEESAILGFPAVTLRASIERPEALETGAIMTTGLDSDAVLPAVRQAVDQRADGDHPTVPIEYQIRNCSQRVVNQIRSSAPLYHSWTGIRRRSAVWQNQLASPGVTR
jgi:UDP-N-acetylglucosamine 2-epimerase (non-hydrolysing)